MKNPSAIGHKRYATTHAGFTLIEIVIAMGITAIVAVLFMRLTRDVTDSTLRFSNSLFTQQQIQQTLQLMVPEIRSASPSNTGGYPISIATSSTLEFYTDIDRDKITFEKVRYFLSGSTFKKGVVKPTGSPLAYVTSTETFADLVGNVIPTNIIFSYFDVSATSSLSLPLVQPVQALQVKKIKINLVANQGTTSTPALVGAETEATIRNLRYK